MQLKIGHNVTCISFDDMETEMHYLIASILIIHVNVMVSCMRNMQTIILSNLSPVRMKCSLQNLFNFENCSWNLVDFLK